MSASDPDCRACNGSGVRYDSGQPRDCECRIRARVMNYLRKHPQLVKGTRPDLTSGNVFLVPGEGSKLIPTRENIVLSAPWPVAVSHLAGWMAAHALHGVYPKVWITSEDEVRNMYFGRRGAVAEAEDRSASLLCEATTYELVVVRIGLSANAATALALLELIQTTATARTPVPTWLILGQGRTLKAHPAFSATTKPLIDAILGENDYADIRGPVATDAAAEEGGAK